MSNRLIKESILTSPNFNRLSIGADALFYRLLLLTDDHGCFRADPSIVRGLCYPLKPNIRNREIACWLDEIEKAGMIKQWQESDKKYAVFVTFRKHQRLKNARRKTPEPPAQIMMLLDESPPKENLELEEELRTKNSKEKNPLVIPPLATENQIKQSFSDLDNVYLTNEQYASLLSRFGQEETGKWIEKLSLWKSAKGKTTRDDYATILRWNLMDQEKQVAQKGKSKDPDRFVKGKFGHMVNR